MPGPPGSPAFVQPMCRSKARVMSADSSGAEVSGPLDAEAIGAVIRCAVLFHFATVILHGSYYVIR